jgi:hypothetical protein
MRIAACGREWPELRFAWRLVMFKSLRSIPMAFAACMAVLALSTSPADSSTVLSVGTTDLVEGCDFIFHGTPIERWVSAGAQPGSIFTNVKFAVSEVLKGDASRKTVVLSYLGGTLDGLTLSIEGLQLPGIGEEGIYFVERLGRNQIHPLLGWDQGLFQVVTDARGHKTVFTHDRRPIDRINREKASWGGISTGYAPGIVIGAMETDAISLEAFKARIRDLVGEQQ